MPTDTPSSTTLPASSITWWMSRWGLRAMWLGYAVFLFIMTHAPIPQPVATVTSNWDKPLHFGAYFVLSLLTVAVCLKTKPYHISHQFLFVVLLLYAAFDEILQGPFGRYPDSVDWVFDCLGIAAGLLIAQGVVWFLNRNEFLPCISFKRSSIENSTSSHQPSGFAR